MMFESELVCLDHQQIKSITVLTLGIGNGNWYALLQTSFDIFMVAWSYFLFILLIGIGVACDMLIFLIHTLNLNSMVGRGSGQTPS